MRLLIVVVLASCHQGEVETLRIRLAESERELAESKEALTAVTLERNRFAAAALPCSEGVLVEQFRRSIASQAAEFSYTFGDMKAFFDEYGRLRDPGKTARLVKDKIAKRGSVQLLGTLIYTFGSEVGAAIYYDRIH